MRYILKKRIVFSLYIDIPKEDLDWQPPHHGHSIPKTEHTKIEFQKNSPWLRKMQEKYCESINVPYKLFEYDQDYIEYRDWVLSTYPQITHYNIVNFYKIHCMYELIKDYDEILYLDYDVIPNTNENFFEAFDLSTGIAIMEGLAPSQKPIPKTTHGVIANCNLWMPSIRSPAAKWWNAKALAVLTGLPTSEENIKIFNTGIVGASAEQLRKLDYYSNFDETLALMDELKVNEDEMWPECLQKLFGWDNETIWAYKTQLNDVKWHVLGGQWHHFMDKENYIPRNAKFIHVINKNFDYVKNWLNSENTL
jgi:hypothetical protein